MYMHHNQIEDKCYKRQSIPIKDLKIMYYYNLNHLKTLQSECIIDVDDRDNLMYNVKVLRKEIEKRAERKSFSAGLFAVKS